MFFEHSNWLSLVLNSIYYSHTELLFHRLSCTLSISKSCIFPSLSSISVPLRNPFKFFALVEVAKLMFCISAVLTVGWPRRMNFGLLLRTEFVRFTRTLESSSFPTSGKILFTPTSLIYDDSRFLSCVVEPWIIVSDFSTLSIQLSRFEVVLLTLKISSFTPGVSIVLRLSPLMFLLSLDVYIIFLLISTDSSFPTSGKILLARDH